MTYVMLASSVVAATVPMASFIALIWFLDRYDREPLWLMALTFLWGAIGSVLLATIGSLALIVPVAVVAPNAVDAVSAAIIAPLIEEPSKALILLPLLLSRHFDNTTDGFVYGATAGLGFAMTENLLYFANEGLTGTGASFAATVAVRTFYTGVMHAAATATVGACMGMAHFRGWVRLVVGATIGLVLAMGIHALWNGLLTMDAVAGLGGLGFIANLLVFPMEVAFIFALFQACLWNEKGIIRAELSREAEDERTLPVAHAAIVASWMKRSWSRDWLPAHVPRGEYIRVATTLAMRRHQARLVAQRSSAAFYKNRVVHLRKRLHDLQRPNP